MSKDTSMDANIIAVHFIHPMHGGILTLDLPRDTAFSTLTEKLYALQFLAPQKPGYRYLASDHLCGGHHTLGDYIPETARELTLRIFAFPEVLI